jgi:putative transposase
LCIIEFANAPHTGGFPMNDFTTKIVACLAKGEKIDDTIQELFRKELEKAVNELLQVELKELLRYSKYERSGLSNDNSRNGSYERAFNTSYGILNLTIPRDRNSEFNSPVVPKYERKDTRTEELIVKLFQTGLTMEEISTIVESLYDKKYSKTTISNITDQVMANVDAFKQKPLESEYAVIYLDATYIPLRRNTVSKEALHIALGIKLDGTKEILGYAIYPNEAISAWESLLSNLQERGLQRPLLFVTDGIKGIEDTIRSVYPKADIQRCLIHVMRNIAWKVRVSDRVLILSEFKAIRFYENKEQASLALLEFISRWDKTYPKVTESLKGNHYLFTFLDYPKSIQGSLYSTNIIEGLNKDLKRKVKAKVQFPSEESMEKYIVSRLEEYNYRHSMKIHKGFGQAMLDLQKRMVDKYNVT